MNKYLIYLLLLITVCFVSCKKDINNEIIQQGTLQFGLNSTQQKSMLKSTASDATPSSFLISITDTKGNVVIESKKIAVINMNGSYLSEPLSLTIGNYNITKFAVLNSSDSVIYATPLSSSKLAYLVKTPLPIAFSISKDIVTKMVPEVLSVKNTKPEDFGYNSFSFVIVNTFDFLSSVMIYNESTRKWELTTAQILINATDGTIAYEGTLDANTNLIRLRDSSTSFIITVSKSNYATYIDTLSAEELKLYFCSEDKGPLIIRLQQSMKVVDIEGNEYRTVKIGKQIWMVENLKVTKYNDGTPIPNVTDDAAWTSLTTPGYCWYNNDISNKNPYGALYNWYAVNTGKLAPQGWHVPTDADWTTLATFIGGRNAGGKLKEVGTTHWLSPNTEATNETSFTALPGGYRYIGFSSINSAGYYLSTTQATNTVANGKSWYLFNNSNFLSDHSNGKSYGYSVRCVKD